MATVDSGKQLILAAQFLHLPNSSESCQKQCITVWSINRFKRPPKTCCNGFPLKYRKMKLFKIASRHGASVRISRGSSLSVCLSFIYPRPGDKRVWSCWCITVFSQTMGLDSGLSIRARQHTLCSKSCHCLCPCPEEISAAGFAIGFSQKVN